MWADFGREGGPGHQPGEHTAQSLWGELYMTAAEEEQLQIAVVGRGEPERLLIALGRVVRDYGKLEVGLRVAFCALVGSKYAAIVAAGQRTKWLIDECRAVAKAHREIHPEHRDAILAALTVCDEVNEQRSTLVHHVWGTGAGGSVMALGSRYRDYQLRVTGPLTVDQVEATDRILVDVIRELQRVIFDALPEVSNIEAQLRWEDHLAGLSSAKLEEIAGRRRAKNPPARHASTGC
jgi:hypothetical protein